MKCLFNSQDKWGDLYIQMGISLQQSMKCMRHTQVTNGCCSLNWSSGVIAVYAGVRICGKLKCLWI